MSDSAAPTPGQVYWFAETEEPPARYAKRGMVGTPAFLTSDPLQATRFDTRADCLAFTAGTYARFRCWRLVPREHMFMGPAGA
jgi:hypothetical protein